MAFNQNQVKDLFFADVTAAEAAGRPNEVCYVQSLKTFYDYVVAGSAYTVDHTSILSTGNGGDTRWIARAGKVIFIPPAPVAFAGSAGRTITHNYGHTDYQLIINPVADPGGFLGEIWISKAANTAVVYNSGSATGNFDYVIIPSA